MHPALCAFPQACRIVWSDYDSSNDFTVGAGPVNATFVLSIICGIAAGVIQGSVEKKIRLKHPGKFPPDPAEALAKAWKKWRAGDSLRHSIIEGASRHPPAASSIPRGPMPTADRSSPSVLLRRERVSR